MVKVLVTGANGQVGSEIRVLAPYFKTADFIFTDRNELDICNKSNLQDFLDQNSKIECIINCAAYTAVDRAQKEREIADAVNHKAVYNLAKEAKKRDIKLIHISTDYVFDGKNFKPYVETDSVNPQNVYGETKLAGENAILQVAPAGAVILRTSWVYSSFGANFVKTMLRLGKERDEIGVVFDQVGTPTYARDLAETILKIVEDSLQDKNEPEIYHFSNEGVCSWYDFALEIMHKANLNCRVKPIDTKDFPTPATRPHYSILNKSKIKERFGIEIPYWKDSLDKCLKIMGEIE